MTYVAVANAVRYAGGTPVLVDVTPGDLNIDPQIVQDAITSKTKAIVAVHLYGVPADLHTLLKICKENNLLLIEDCAEAHGASINGKIVGSFGDISVFSFMETRLFQLAKVDSLPLVMNCSITRLSFLGDKE